MTSGAIRSSRSRTITTLCSTYMVSIRRRWGSRCAPACHQAPESNIGYTLDMAGNLCAGRDCGYHTHLNVYDKRLGYNIDPLSLIPASYP